MDQSSKENARERKEQALCTRNEVCYGGRLGSHCMERYERPHWGWGCWEQIDQRELGLHTSGSSVSGRSDLCCRHSITEASLARGVKKAARVAAGTLGGEQRGGRKAGTDAEAWETVTYLELPRDCIALIPCMCRCIALISNSICGWRMRAQISMVPQAQGVSVAAAVTRAILEEDFVISWLTWLGMPSGLRTWVPVCLLALALPPFSVLWASVDGSSKHRCLVLLQRERRRREREGVSSGTWWKVTREWETLCMTCREALGMVLHHVEYVLWVKSQSLTT